MQNISSFVTFLFQSPVKGATIPYHPSLTNISSISTTQLLQKDHPDVHAVQYHNDGYSECGLDHMQLLEKSSLAATASSFTSFASSATTAIQQPTDESVILITSPYTNGLTVPAMINQTSTNQGQLVATSAPVVFNGPSVLSGDVSCSSMTSPPVTPPQAVASTASPTFSTQINTTPSSISISQHNTKEGSSLPSNKIMLTNSQIAPGSQLQGNGYIPATMFYATSPLGLPVSSVLTKPSFSHIQYANTNANTFTSPQLNYSGKSLGATSPAVMSPPVTPFLDPQSLCIPPSVNGSLNEPTVAQGCTQSIFSPVMCGPAGPNTNTSFPPHNVLPFISSFSNGVDLSQGGSTMYPNHLIVSNTPGEPTQCLSIKNNGGYFSPGNSTLPPYAYPPSNNLHPSPSMAVHVTSDRSVYSTTVSDVSL